MVFCYGGAQHNANDKLHKLQKKAIRIITSRNFLAHSEPIFKQLHLLKSYDIYKCQLLKFLFKLVNKQLPAYFNQLPFAFNNHLHHHETRGFKGALYRIQILCRRYTFWSYPAGLTIADTPGKQKLKYRRVYSHHFQTTIAESIHTTPNSIQCPFKRAFVPRVNHEFSKRNIRYIAAVTYNSTSDSVIAKIYTQFLASQPMSRIK